MELRVLRYFLMVAREENITKAAQLLHVTQPTLSRQLIRLEEELGTTLFHRSSHHIILTEDGMLLKRRAQEILELTDKTEREFSSPEELTGEIAIGCGETCNMARLSELMVSFQEQHPLVQYRVYSATADEVRDRMGSGLLDIGLLMEPIEIQRYDSLPMPYRERWGALVRQDSPLARLEAVTPRDLLPYPLLVSWRGQVNQQLAAWFGEDFARVRVAARFNLIINAAMMVKHHVGVALCLDLGTAVYPSLRMVPFSPTLESGAVLAWNKNQIRSRAVEQFIAHVCRHTPDKAPEALEGGDGL